MKRRIFTAFFLVFLAAGFQLFASGKKQAASEEKDPVNPEWTLCITAFDTSSLSPAWQTAGDTMTRNIAAALQNLDFRTRGEEETDYYHNIALVRSRESALDALVKKRNERDLLLFKGDPSWKYRKELKTIDEAILKLEEQLAALDVPVVEEKPVFALAEKNKNGTFPLPPKAGLEKRFCTDEKTDAFLVGTISEYYGRAYLDFKMYTRYSGSYSYESSVLFSFGDFNEAIDEIVNHLSAVVSETIPASIYVHSSPPDAMVTVNGGFAGRGEVELLNRSPGTVEIEVRADKHAPVSIPLELNSGEHTELFINLTPLGRTVFEAVVPDKPGSRVFLGGLYMGETPLALELSSAESTYISVETPEGEIGSVILRNNNLIHGKAQFAKRDDIVSADFLTAYPLTEEEKKVEKTRRNFYTAYGAFWVILPVALLSAGIAGNYIAANDYVNSNNLYQNDPEKRDKIRSNASMGNTIQIFSNGLIGVSLGLTFYQIFRYLYVSGGDSTPIVKKGTVR